MVIDIQQRYDEIVRVRQATTIQIKTISLLQINIEHIYNKISCEEV
jgi:hypothetical protein